MDMPADIYYVQRAYKPMILCASTISEECKEKIVQIVMKEKKWPREAISIDECFSVIWTDSSLGVDTGNPSLTVMTPGYRVLLSAGEEKVILHMNESGCHYILIHECF
jgi:hypothetical protein